MRASPEIVCTSTFATPASFTSPDMVRMRTSPILWAITSPDIEERSRRLPRGISTRSFPRRSVRRPRKAGSTRSPKA